MAKEIQHENRAHAVLSASSSHRWLNCPASIKLEATMPEPPESAAAVEGTAAHELAEYKVRRKFKMKVGKRPKSDLETAEMDDMTSDYADYIYNQLERLGGLEKVVARAEVRVDYSKYAPGGFGTADCVLIGEEELHIIDLKFGKGVLVSAQDNPQLKLYALGVLDMLDYPDNLKTVTCHIFQPRREHYDTWTTTVEDLIKFGEWVRPIADEALAGSEKQCTGEWCTFCKAQAKCRAHALTMLDIVEKSETSSPSELSDEEIDELLPKLDEVQKWARSVLAYAQEQALAGKKWNTFKLVQTRSNRKYTDEAKVAEALEAAGVKDFYKKSLLSLSDMEKLLGKKDFKTILTDTGLVYKPEGGITLVSRADRREEINIDFGFRSEET